MRIEDMKNWTIDQLKEEVVRMADECEKKQHEILDKNEKINELQAELDKMCDYNKELKEQISDTDSLIDTSNSGQLMHLRLVHEVDCIAINQLHTTIDVLIDRYANLRKIHGLK